MDRDVIARDVKRLEDERRPSVTGKVSEIDTHPMYSGSVTSPKELQAMQAEIDQLRRHRATLEDRGARS